MNAIGDRRAVSSILGAATVALGVIPLVYIVVKNAFRGTRLQAQYTSSQFVLAAGAVPFQFDTNGVPRRVLLVHHTSRDAWMLAKGRKDEGEDLATTATREVHEETGYPCRLHPVPRLPTCAPNPYGSPGDGFQPHYPHMAENSTEPFMVTFRPIGLRMMKLIFWYIGAVDVPYDTSTCTDTMQPGSHQLAEGFGEVRLFDIAEALEVLEFKGDRALVQTAAAILAPHAGST